MPHEIQNIRVPLGAYMLMWFTNPLEIPREDGSSWNSIQSRFFESLPDAEKLADLLSGNRIILTAFQDAIEPGRASSIGWYVTKTYGEHFDISKIDVLSEEMRQRMIKVYLPTRI